MSRRRINVMSSITVSRRRINNYVVHNCVEEENKRSIYVFDNYVEEENEQLYHR